MQLDDKSLADFQSLYEQAFSKAITATKAREMAQRALDLYDLLLRPLTDKSHAHRHKGSDIDF